MSAEFFFDTNVLIYAFTQQDARKIDELEIVNPF